jgi:hypothetical protein
MRDRAHELREAAGNRTPIYFGRWDFKGVLRIVLFNFRASHKAARNLNHAS